MTTRDGNCAAARLSSAGERALAAKTTNTAQLPRQYLVARARARTSALLSANSTGNLSSRTRVVARPFAAHTRAFISVRGEPQRRARAQRLDAQSSRAIHFVARDSSSGTHTHTAKQIAPLVQANLVRFAHASTCTPTQLTGSLL